MQFSKREGRKASISTLVSNPKIWITNPKNWILQVRQSLLSTEKLNWSVIPFSTPLPSFVDLIKVYQYRQVNITEDRGTPTPTPPTMERNGIGLFVPMESGFFPSCFALDNPSLDYSNLRTFSVAPCLGRVEPNAPGGGGGDDI